MIFFDMVNKIYYSNKQLSWHCMLKMCVCGVEMISLKLSGLLFFHSAWKFEMVSLPDVYVACWSGQEEDFEMEISMLDMY